MKLRLFIANHCTALDNVWTDIKAARHIVLKAFCIRCQISPPLHNFVQVPILIDDTKIMMPKLIGKGGVWQCTNVTVRRWSSFNAPTPRLLFWRGEQRGILDKKINVPKFEFRT